MTDKPKRILLAAGGTGGHFFPAVATGKKLAAMGYEVHMVTDKRCKKYIHKINYIQFKVIDLYLRTGSTMGKLKAPVQIATALIRNMIFLIKLRPAITIGFGGYPSFPTLLATKLTGVPIALHEQNSFLGKVNHFFARGAKFIGTSYKKMENSAGLPKGKVKYVGDVVREEIARAQMEHDFKGETLRIFVFGGSQGAKFFSKLIPEAIELASAADKKFKCTIVQQAQKADHAKIKSVYDKLKIKHELAEFYHNMPEIYARSDILISRSGASTIAECSALGMPAILIPFPYAAEDHQKHNALAVEALGGGWCLPEDMDNIADKLAGKLIEINRDRELLEKTSRAIKERKTDGATELATTVDRIISGKKL